MSIRKADMRVPLGEVIIVPDAAKHARRCGRTVEWLLYLHEQCDWGDGLTEEEKRSNDIALRTGARIFSSYNLSSGKQVWIITDPLRYTTTVTMADDT